MYGTRTAETKRGRIMSSKVMPVFACVGFYNRNSNWKITLLPPNMTHWTMQKCLKYALGHIDDYGHCDHFVVCISSSDTIGIQSWNIGSDIFGDTVDEITGPQCDDVSVDFLTTLFAMCDEQEADYPPVLKPFMVSCANRLSAAQN